MCILSTNAHAQDAAEITTTTIMVQTRVQDVDGSVGMARYLPQFVLCGTFGCLASPCWQFQSLGFSAIRAQMEGRTVVGAK